MTIRPIFARIPRLAGAALILLLATSPGSMAACSDPAGPNVDWSGCALNDVNVSGMDLHGADLTGAQPLFGRDHADLRGADLSGAIWTDSSICAPGTIGDDRGFDLCQ
jgi:uncharacterized protein YjbI with pentapeptide repeats